MKIAIPTSKNMIDNHFGHCESFTIIEVDDSKKIINKEMLKGDSTCGCKSGLAGELEKMNVKMLLAGGIGEGAVKKLKTHDIDVIMGFSGTIDEVIENWKSNNYPTDFKICTEHHSCSH